MYFEFGGWDLTEQVKVSGVLFNVIWVKFCCCFFGTLRIVLLTIFEIIKFVLIKHLLEGIY